MFSIPLGFTTLPKELCDQLKPLKGFGQDGPESDDAFNILADYPHIEKVIGNTFALWVNTIYNRPKQKWIVTTSWITENLNGIRLASHNHLNALWSAVLYFDTITENFAPLQIENPIMPQGIQVYPEAPLNPFTSLTYECPIKEGTILFFPSYCKHFHDEYEQKKGAPLRRSLALNFLPTGFIGSGDSTLDTNWLSHDDS